VRLQEFPGALFPAEIMEDEEEGGRRDLCLHLACHPPPKDYSLLQGSISQGPGTPPML
jgi:hypothetical protein